MRWGADDRCPESVLFLPWLSWLFSLFPALSSVICIVKNAVGWDAFCMPDSLTILQDQVRGEKPLSEVWEVVRVVNLLVPTGDVSKPVRITIARNYTAIEEPSYDARYEVHDEHGRWVDHSFGSIVSHGGSEESALTQAISFVREAFEMQR